MINKSKKAILDNLIKQIEYHNNLYYNNDSPEISDAEYDNLKKKIIYILDCKMGKKIRVKKKI